MHINKKSTVDIRRGYTDGVRYVLCYAGHSVFRFGVTKPDRYALWGEIHPPHTAAPLWISRPSARTKVTEHTDTAAAR